MRDSDLSVLVFVGLFNGLLSKVFFHEDFNDPSWKERWIPTEVKSYKGKPYGNFEWTPGRWFVDPNDRALRTTEVNQYYLISTKFPKFSNKDIPLVIQHTVKFESYSVTDDRDRHCAAGFIKLYPAKFNSKTMDSDSKFLVKFGPDLCPTSGVTEASLFHKGKYYDHRPRREKWDRTVYTYAPMIYLPRDQFTHLYTFVIFPNSTIQKRIDGEITETGYIDEDWRITGPREVYVKREMPEGWDIREKIFDPTDQKPADWVEEEFIADPHASLPEDWDELVDGEWAPPVILNPAYKGQWHPTKLIPNPNYSGPWIEEYITNPDYKFDPEVYILLDIGGVGIDVWQEQAGTVFDNILITDDLDFALKSGTEIQQKIRKVEQKSFEDECEIERLKRVADLEKIARLKTKNVRRNEL